jgi:hypothetical protein
VTDAGTVVEEFVHRELGREVVAVGGHYELVREARLPIGQREVLYLVGHAAFETTCCGVGGCAYALVPGFVVRWKAGVDEAGHAVSLVERIRDRAVQQEVRRHIGRFEIVHQVIFQ